MIDGPPVRSASDGENLDRLLLRLDPDRTRAGQKYEEIRRQLIKFFRWNRSWRAEELADQVLVRVAQKESQEIHDIRAFALKVGRYVLMEEDRRVRRQTSIEDVSGKEGPADGHDTEREIVEKIYEQSRLECLRACRAKLLPADNDFVIAYYGAEGEKQKIHRQNLARTLGMSMTAVRVRANRIRDRLELCVTECLEGQRKPLPSGLATSTSESSRSR